MDLTPRAKNVMDIASRVAVQMGDQYVGRDHLVLAVLRDGGSVACHILQQHGVTESAIMAALGHWCDYEI
jgi:ATP-dependent Clp protease ATP-binding subunit ClpC